MRRARALERNEPFSACGVYVDDECETEEGRLIVLDPDPLEEEPLNINGLVDVEDVRGGAGIEDELLPPPYPLCADPL